MAKMDVQKWIIEKCLKENKTPFEQSDTTFTWSGDTRVKNKRTERVYPVHVEIQVQADRRTKDQLSACLCRESGVRVEDLQIVHMINPRINGHINITGLPSHKVQTDFSKFLKQIVTDD
ncbi:hypothetical protein [Alicyclobacillus dauci]|uniref:Uncharacterized protein n=1 Tax=Alicyclobacillus dauci TaxID=1475485 RepID=A0ABY6Z4Y6_9BACL|nr:hypothetical protein [Alicyclobacillus dauci]WAH37943.1 hypothetical protein NZD86_05475 [Alicyclobacillus dauci]